MSMLGRPNLRYSRRLAWGWLGLSFLWLALPAAAHGGRLREVDVPGFPEEGFSQLSATEAGEGWALAEDKSGRAPALWWLGSEGAAKRLSPPDPVVPRRIAWSRLDEGLWVAGEQGAAFLDSTGSWHMVQFEAGEAPDAVVPLGRWQAAVLRHSGWGAEVLFVDVATGAVLRVDQFTGADVYFEAAVSDGTGGFWALLDNGYVHCGSDGAWRAWTEKGVWARGKSPENFTVVGKSPDSLGDLNFRPWFLASDGSGGFHATAPHTGLFGDTHRGGGGLFHVHADGRADENPRALLGGVNPELWIDLTYDQDAKALVLLSGGHARSLHPGPGPQEEFEAPLKLTRLASGMLEDEALPLPSWGGDLWMACRGIVSASSSVTWVALEGRWEGLVLRRGPQGWTAYASEALKLRQLEEMRASRTELATHLSLGLLGASLSIGLGAYGASRIRDERMWVTTAQSLGGSVLAIAPGLLALGLSPFTNQWDIEGGISIAAAGTLAGVLLETGAGALGAWATGQWALGGSRSPAMAFAGAFGGALVGALSGLLLDAVLHQLPADIGEAIVALRWSLGIGMVGVGATAGYQWLGGGRRPRP